MPTCSNKNMEEKKETTSAPEAAPNAASTVEKEHNNTPTIVTIIFLVLIPLVGIVLMWAWAKWPKWVKILITTLYALSIVLFIVFFSAVVATINPKAQLKKAEAATCVNECITTQQLDQDTCIQQCGAEGIIPAGATDSTDSNTPVSD